MTFGKVDPSGRPAGAPRPKLTPEQRARAKRAEAWRADCERRAVAAEADGFAATARLWRRAADKPPE